MSNKGKNKRQKDSDSSMELETIEQTGGAVRDDLILKQLIKLTEKIDLVLEKNEVSERRITNLEKTAEMALKIAKEKNIIVNGIKEDDTETLDVLEFHLNKLFEELGITPAPLLDNFYRFTKKAMGKNRPIIVKFVRMVDKQKIMQNRHKTFKNKVYINEDLTPKDQKVQVILREEARKRKMQDHGIITRIRGQNLQIFKDNNLLQVLHVDENNKIQSGKKNLTNSSQS